jgi:hypothetical protein
MVWFIVGAAIGCIQVALRFLPRRIYLNHPIQGFLFAAAMGAVVYGTVLWLLAKLIF